MKSDKKDEKDWGTVEVMKAVNDKLTSYVRALEQRNRELRHLHELGTLLQACLTVEKAYAVIARTVPKLFLSESGGVYLFNPPLQPLVPVGAWSELIKQVSLGFTKSVPVIAWGAHTPSEELFPEMAGWTLLQEPSYSGDGRHHPVLSPGDKQPGQDARFCAPLVSQHQTLGLLYVQASGAVPNPDQGLGGGMLKYKRELAVTAAQTIALFLTNINLRESLYQQSIHDPLTGLLNRRPMYAFMEKELQRTARKNQPMGVIMIDIDHFKKVNDTYGHEVGDTVLHEFGQFCQKQTRAGDFVCRYGGEEFLVVLTESSRENVQKRAEQFREEASLLTVRYHGRILDPITLSLGVAVYPENGQTAHDLVLAADEALHRAKANGRNQIAMVQ